MGILLTFMFAWSMIGAPVLTLERSYFLLNPQARSEPASAGKRTRPGNTVIETTAATQ